MLIISELNANAKIYPSMEKDGKSSLGMAEDFGKGTGVLVFDVPFLQKKKKVLKVLKLHLDT